MVDEDGHRFVWVDDGLHRIGEHGEAELEPVELEELDNDEVRQVARSSIYTWEFTNFTVEDVSDPAQTNTIGVRPSSMAVEESDPPG